MYRLVEVKQGAYGLRSFDGERDYTRCRDAVEAAESLVAFRRRVKRARWRTVEVQVLDSDGVVQHVARM